MSIHLAEPEPSDGLLIKSVKSTRLRAWLNLRLSQLDSSKWIHDARALHSEFIVDYGLLDR